MATSGQLEREVPGDDLGAGGVCQLDVGDEDARSTQHAVDEQRGLERKIVHDADDLSLAIHVAAASEEREELVKLGGEGFDPGRTFD